MGCGMFCSGSFLFYLFLLELVNVYAALTVHGFDG